MMAFHTPISTVNRNGIWDLEKRLATYPTTLHLSGSSSNRLLVATAYLPDRTPPVRVDGSRIHGEEASAEAVEIKPGYFN